jgi:lysophospholipase L1-like esterase
MTGNSLESPGDLRKVVLLGDSFVESLFAQERERFASILERDLNANGFGYQVLNGGYSGATLLHSFNVFMNKVVPLAPFIERVLIFTGMSDLRALTRKQSYWAPDVTHAPVIDPRNKQVPDDRPATTTQQGPLLRSFIDAARNFGQEPVVVCSPFRSGSFDEDAYAEKAHGDRATHDKALARMHMINASAKSTGEEMGARVIDAEQAFEGLSHLFYDTMHLNVAGHQVMASFLASELKGILPRR